MPISSLCISWPSGDIYVPLVIHAGVCVLSALLPLGLCRTGTTKGLVAAVLWGLPVYPCTVLQKVVISGHPHRQWAKVGRISLHLEQLDCSGCGPSLSLFTKNGTYTLCEGAWTAFLATIHCRSIAWFYYGFEQVFLLYLLLGSLSPVTDISVLQRSTMEQL